MREKENLTLLGNQQTEYRMDYDPSVLEAFQNKLRQVQLPGIHKSVPNHRTARFCNNHDFLCSGRTSCGE